MGIFKRDPGSRARNWASLGMVFILGVGCVESTGAALAVD